mgnify:FL=1|jgi:hypothetical protein
MYCWRIDSRIFSLDRSSLCIRWRMRPTGSSARVFPLLNLDTRFSSCCWIKLRDTPKEPQNILSLPGPRSPRMSTRPLDSAAALDPDRHFTLQDARNAYALADQPTHLGRQVKHALGVIETALDRYRCVFSRSPPSPIRLQHFRSASEPLR